MLVLEIALGVFLGIFVLPKIINSAMGVNVRWIKGIALTIAGIAILVITWYWRFH
jgi:hypothetical protein